MNSIKKKAVFLDRDGVINKVIFHGSKKPSSPWEYKEFKFIKGIKKPLQELKNMGFLLFIVSNQPDISRGHIKKGVTERIIQTIYKNLPITEIVVCPHDDYHNCDCRKPKPGMIFMLSKKYNINIEKSFFIGDSWKDMEAAKKVGCTSFLLDRDYNKGTEAEYKIKNIKQAVTIIKNMIKI